MLMNNSGLVFVQCSAMAVSYFGTGSYVQNSPVKPNQGIDFYVQNSFMQTYSAGTATSIFNWNDASHTAKVDSIMMYPASSPANAIPIATDSDTTFLAMGRTVFLMLTVISSV